jgi:hypothetical protein
MHVRYDGNGTDWASSHGRKRKEASKQTNRQSIIHVLLEQVGLVEEEPGVVDSLAIYLQQAKTDGTRGQ